MVVNLVSSFAGDPAGLVLVNCTAGTLPKSPPVDTVEIDNNLKLIRFFVMVYNFFLVITPFPSGFKISISSSEVRL